MTHGSLDGPARAVPEAPGSARARSDQAFKTKWYKLELRFVRPEGGELFVFGTAVLLTPGRSPTGHCQAEAGHSDRQGKMYYQT